MNYPEPLLCRLCGEVCTMEVCQCLRCGQPICHRCNELGGNYCQEHQPQEEK